MADERPEVLALGVASVEFDVLDARPAGLRRLIRVGRLMRELAPLGWRVSLAVRVYEDPVPGVDTSSAARAAVRRFAESSSLLETYVFRTAPTGRSDG